MSFSDAEVERYARHLVLSELGGPGQQRLRASSVLVVGAGGVGCPAAMYLAAAGIGRLGLVDDDTVALSNLQRQVLFATADVGRPKVEAARERLAAMNPHVGIEAIDARIGDDNADGIIAGYDLVLDGTDDFATRLAVNAACVRLGRPLVSGALGRWSGQVALFEGRPCYRCLVPEIPPDAETCARVGVVGAVPGVIGAMAAMEAIKRLAGAGEPLAGRMLIYNGLAATARAVRVAADPACPVCAQAKAADSIST